LRGGGTSLSLGGTEGLCRLILLARHFSTRADGADRAGIYAGTAVDADIRIDLVLVASGGNGIYRAAVDAGPAVGAIVADYVCHGYCSFWFKRGEASAPAPCREVRPALGQKPRPSDGRWLLFVATADLVPDGGQGFFQLPQPGIQAGRLLGRGLLLRQKPAATETARRPAEAAA